MTTADLVPRGAVSASRGPAVRRSRRSRGFVRGLAALTGLFATLAPGGGRAQELPDSSEVPEGAVFLLLPVGAHGVGMGRAMTALHSEEAAFWNPAGLAGQSERRTMVYSGDQLGPAIAVNMLYPWSRVGTLGLSYFLLDIGDQEIRSPDGTPLGSITHRNHLGIASFATSLPVGIQVGVNVKTVQYRVGCRGQCENLATTRSAYAADVGVQAEPFKELPLRFGWMLAHAGTEFRTRNEDHSAPLPTRVRFAVAYEVLHRFVDDGTMDLWVAVEAEDRARDPGSPSVHVGLNFSAAGMVDVRAGYVHVRAGHARGQLDGATVGLGFRFDRFDLNLAKYLERSIVTQEGQPIHVSLGVSF